MSTIEEYGFMYVWNIKHFHKFMESATFNGISSPSFEFLKGTEWHLKLEKLSTALYCSILRNSTCYEIPEHITVDYEYELTTSDGVILKKSALLSETFSYDSSDYEIMELFDSNTPEDVSLRCRMMIPCIIPSMILSPRSVVGWEAETDVVATSYNFEWSLMFSGYSNWTAVERVVVENIPIDVEFKYEHELKIKLIPKIVDHKFHTVKCRMYLKVNGKSVNGTYGSQECKFSNTTREYNLPNSVDQLLLEEAKCFIHKRINMEVMFEYLQNSSITEVKSFNKNSPSVKCVALTQNKDDSDSILYLQQHLKNLLNEKTYADVKLRADDEVFFAHKCLLASRSPVFRSMFDQEMLESKTNIIDIHDVEANTLKYFLEYIYTGTVNDLNDETALNLLVVADKYQVSPLTEKCSAFLKSDLNLDNILNVLLIADMVNQEQLKIFSIEYIVENSTQVLSTANWSKWMKANPTLASEIFLRLSKKFDSTINL